MKPSEWLQSVKGYYPESSCFGEVELPRADLRSFVSLWISEGVPYAFLDCPAAFQAARERFAGTLGVVFRDVSITGSARLGYSLSPKKFGSKFQPGNSDIDLFVVDRKWFEKLAMQAGRFINDFHSGKVSPRNPTEARYWPDNIKVIKSDLEAGFIDARNIPTLDEYPAVQKILTAAYEFGINVNQWSGKPLVAKCSARTYIDWSAAIERITYNLKSALKYRATFGSGPTQSEPGL